MVASPLSQLCPAQARAFDALSSGLEVASILCLSGGAGRGKTTILRQLQAQTGGAFLNAEAFLRASVQAHPLALEETLYRLVVEAFDANATVYVDDVHLLDLSSGCHFYPRSGMFNATLMGICTYASEAGKKLIFGTDAPLSEAAQKLFI